MNEIMMNQKVSKWNEACRFLKGKQSELSVEEWTAVELLADFWRERSFDEDSVAECEGLIATLSACDKLHIANLDIITWSKEFRGIAKAMYTKDKETFEQFREAMKKFNRANRPQPSRPAPERPSAPSPAPVNNILLKQHLQKWHKAAVYLLGVWGELGRDEQEALQLLLRICNAEWNDKNLLERCVNVLAGSDKLHAANKDIIVQSKELRGICRQYLKDLETFQAFRKALSAYLASNPLPAPRIEEPRREEPRREEPRREEPVRPSPQQPRRPNPSFSPSIRITRVDFANGDVKGNLLSSFGSPLYTNMAYLTPRISYQVLRSGGGQADIWYKLFSPSGMLMTAQGGRDGYTWHGFVGLAASGTVALGGFGGDACNTFTATGTWTIEFYEEDHLLYRSQFRVTDKPAPPPPKRHRWVWFLVLAALLWGGYEYWYKDYKKEKDAPRYYVYADNLFLRSSAVADVEYNRKTTLPYGSELITFSNENGWAYVKSGGESGYVASDYILEAADFQLLNGVWGNDEARDAVSTAKCRLALFDYLKSNNLQTGSTAWQLFAKQKEVKPNSILFPRLNDGYDHFTEFAFILKDNATGQRKLVLYAFEENETPVFRYAEDAPESGDIRSITYNQWSKKYKVNYSGAAPQARSSVVVEREPQNPEVAAADKVTIRSVQFANVDDNGKILTGYGLQLYSDIQYLRSRVYFKKQTADKEKIEFGVKIYQPDGNLVRGQSSPVGYTFLHTINFGHQEGSFELMGWGNPDGRFYTPGTYRYEIWCDGQKLYSTQVDVKAKQQAAAVTSAPDNRVYDRVDQMPQFPQGGMSGMIRYLSKNIDYPKSAQENGTQGTVRVQFVVGTDGSLTDFKIVQSVDPALDKEALRVVMSMPKWKPGTMNGKPVRVRYTLPVAFKLN